MAVGIIARELLTLTVNIAKLAASKYILRKQPAGVVGDTLQDALMPVTDTCWNATAMAREFAGHRWSSPPPR